MVQQDIYFCISILQPSQICAMKRGIVSYANRDIYYDLFVNETSAVAPVLLLGGVLQNRHSWHSYIKELQPLCPVLAVDLPGIGEAGVLDAAYGFGYLADCIYAVMEELAILKVNIFSTSYSSVIAYEFSRKYPGCTDQLVISSSMANLPDKQRKVMTDCITALQENDLQSFYKIFIDGVSHPEKIVSNYDLSRKVIAMLINALTQQEITQFIENTKRVLQYNIPAHIAPIALTPLIFTGEYDTFTPPHLCRQISSLYTDSYFGTLAGYDHLFHIGNRRTIIQNILPFFCDDVVPNFANSKDRLRVTY